MNKFKKIKTLTMRMFKAKRGKCPYCGVTTHLENKKRGCKHLKSKAPTSDMIDGKIVYDGKAVWKFERPIKPLTFTRQGRKLHLAAMKQLRAKLLTKAQQTDPEQSHYEEAVSSDQDAVKAYLATAEQRGGRKSKAFVSKEGLSEYLKPKYKRQLTILKKQKSTKKIWSSLDKTEKKILKGKIRNLSNRVREAKRQAKLAIKVAKWKTN